MHDEAHDDCAIQVIQKLDVTNEERVCAWMFASCRDAPLDALGSRFGTVGDPEAILAVVADAFPAVTASAVRDSCKAGFAKRRELEKDGQR